MTVPWLHVVTDDAVLAAAGFRDRAAALLQAHGPSVALHVRGHGTPGRALYQLAASLVGPAGATGATLLVNDRIDVALAAGCGAQIGRRSIPVASARSLLGDRVALGCSVHDPGEAAAAVVAGADFVVLGTIWPTPSHPGAGGAGLGIVAEVAATVAAPVVVIGGVTPQRAREAMDAGGHGVAVLRGVWAAPDPVAAATAYLEAMGARR